VLELIEVLEADRQQQRDEKEKLKDYKATEEAAETERKSELFERIQHCKMLYRVQRHGVKCVMPRTLRERRPSIRKKPAQRSVN